METYLLLTLIVLVLILILVQVFKINIPIHRPKYLSEDGTGLGLDEIIQSMSDDIMKSQKRVHESGGKSVFFVNKAQVTLSFLVKKTVSGDVKLIAADVDGEYATEKLHQVTLDLSTTPPFMQTIIENALSKHKDVNKAMLEIENLLSDDTNNIFGKYQQKAGE